MKGANNVMNNRQQNTPYPPKLTYFVKRISFIYQNLCYVNSGYHKLKTFPLLPIGCETIRNFKVNGILPLSIRRSVSGEIKKSPE